jgi:hypothetical protein
VAAAVAAAAAAAVVLGAVPAAVSAAGTLDVPGDFATIQAAIDAAAPGDTVLVSPGTYPERIDFEGKAVTVASSGGPDVTVIDGGGQGRVVTFANGERRDSVLRGFTIRDGRMTAADGPGAGIEALSASPTIEGNVITGNSACAEGGGIAALFGSPLIQGNTITGNASSDQGCTGAFGGGIALRGRGEGSAQVVGNIISGNRSFWAGAIALFGAGTPTVANNVITGNTAASDGGAIWNVNQSDSLIQQNLFLGNRSSGNGGAIAANTPSGQLGPVLVANTFSGNAAVDGTGLWTTGFPGNVRVLDNLVVGGDGEGAVYCDRTISSSAPRFDHNDAFTPNGGTGFEPNCGVPAGTSGNISVDPLFVSPTDLHLGAGSPAIDAGAGAPPDLPGTDLDGSPRVVGPAVDLGVYELQTPAPPPPTATFDPASVDFGTIPGGRQVVDAAVTLTNTGGSPLAVTAAATDGGVFSVEADACSGITLSPADSCIVRVGFLPISPGVSHGTLSVTDGLGTQSVPLTGTVITGSASGSPVTIDFGSVRVYKRGQAATATITNTGNADLNIGNLSLTGSNPGDFVILKGRGTTCSYARLPVGATCTVQLAFKPTATGARSALLLVASDDPVSPVGVFLTGTGT